MGSERGKKTRVSQERTIRRKKREKKKKKRKKQKQKKEKGMDKKKQHRRAEGGTRELREEYSMRRDTLHR